ncbi:MAG: 2-amino-4-hydroxy-6-hydroxymethyldihydropteridine diphosphokinase, partial [Bacteroidota bacterium]
MRSAKPNRVRIGLGGNLGDPACNLKQAVNLLEERFGTKLVLSPVYRSEPVGVREQPWFLNQAAYFDDNLRLGPISILEIMKEIESQMGREPTVRFGPRLIDLDLLFYDDWVWEGADLIIPHPRFSQRSFVLLPLMDLEPDLVDPRSGKTLRQIWEQGIN